MTMTVNTLQRHPASGVSGFDQVLGASSRRYLGGGHNRVSLHVADVTRLTEDTFGACATVIYPRDWSVKEGQERRPHLSTVDALRIADITHKQILDTHLAWLSCYAASSLEVRAGAKPCEALEEVAVASRIQGTPGDDVVVLAHKVGTLAVAVTWTRQAEDKRGETPPANQFIASIDSVQLESAATASCRVRRDTAGPAELPFVEALTLTAQLAQVVLYGGDSTSREKSPNMWMRRARFDRLDTPEAVTSQVAVRLHGQRELSVAGQAIRTAEVLASDVCGIKVTASLAMHA